ncbi:hypothetical protein NDU88_000838 [Pleurodeles waltl]|uniref:Uncharacterized protein n=1 Tax=Pleurodeles waltl TaxID=8319 RepID=A0AAV7TGY2_PLEWA|nr:hypothetical protein NDU88_000838 [Pleurodeles waltl]
MCPPRDAVSADYVPQRLLQQRRVARGTGLPSRLFPHLGLHKRHAPRGTRFQRTTSPSASCSSIVLPGEQDFPPGSFLTWGYIRDAPPAVRGFSRLRPPAPPAAALCCRGNMTSIPALSSPGAT